MSAICGDEGRAPVAEPSPPQRNNHKTRKWPQSLLNWVNCVLGTDAFTSLTYKSLFALIKYFDGIKEDGDDDQYLEQSIVLFLKREYPYFRRGKHIDVINSSDDAALIASLLLHYSCVKSKDVTLQGTMCQQLDTADQKAILIFANNLMKHENITERNLQNAIAAIAVDGDHLELSYDDKATAASSTPLRLKMNVLFNSPLAKSPLALTTPSSMRSRKVFHLEAELGAERFDRNFLQEEVERQCQRILELEKLQDTYREEVQRLRRELNLVGDSSNQNEIENCNQCKRKEKMLEEELRSHELEILRLLSNIQNVEEERDSLITRLTESEHAVSVWSSQAIESESVRDTLKSQLETAKSEMNGLRAALLDANQCLEEYRRENHLNNSVEWDDDTLPLKKSMNSSLIASAEDLGKAVIDIQLKEQINRNFILNDKLETVTKDKKDVEEELGKTKEIVLENENAIKKLTDTNQDLSIKVQSCMVFEEKFKETQQCLQDATNAAQELENSVANLQNECQHKSGLVMSLTDEKNRLSQTIKTDKITIDNLNKEMDMKCGEILSLSDKLIDVESKYSTLVDENCKVLDRLTNACNDVKSLNDEVASFKAVVNDYEVQLDGKNLELCESDRKLDALKQQCQELQNAINSHIYMRKQSEDDNLVLKTNFDVLTKQYISASEIFDNRYAEFERETSSKNVHMDELLLKFCQLEKDLSRCRLRCENLDKDLQTKNSTVDELLDKNVKLVDRLKECEEISTSEKHEIVQLTEEKIKFTNDSSILLEKYNKLIDDHKILVVSFEEITNERNDLWNSVESYKIAAEDRSKELRTKSDLVFELEGKLNSLESQHSELFIENIIASEKIKSARNNVKSLNVDVSACKTVIEDCRVQIENAKLELETRNNELENVKQDCKMLKKSISACEEQLSAKEKEYEQLKSKFDQIENQNFEYQVKFENLTGDLTAKKEGYDTLMKTYIELETKTRETNRENRIDSEILNDNYFKLLDTNRNTTEQYEALKIDHEKTVGLLNEITKERNELRTDNSSYKNCAQDFRNIVWTKECIIEDLNNQISVLNVQVKSLIADYSLRRLELVKLESLQAESKSQLFVSHNDLSNVKKELESVSFAYENAQDVIAEYEKFTKSSEEKMIAKDKELNESTQVNAALKEESRKFEQMTISYSNQILTLTEENVEYSKVFAEKFDRLKGDCKTQCDLIETLTVEKDDLNDSVVSYIVSVEDLNKEIEDKSNVIAELTDKYSDLESKYSELVVENGKCTNDISTFKTLVEMHERQFVDNKNQLLDTRNELDTMKQIQQKLQDSVASYEGQLSESEENIALKNKKFEELSLSYGRLEKQVSDVEIQTTLKTNELDVMKQDYQRSKDSIVSYEKLVSKSREKIALKNREFDELSMNLSQLEKQLSDVEIQFALKNNELDTVRQDYQKLQDSVASYEKLAAESEGNFELKNREFDELTLDYSRLKEQSKNVEIKTELNEIKRELQEARDFIESIKNLVSQSEVNIALKNVEFDQLNLNYVQLENNLSDAETQISLKNNELDLIKKDYQKLQDSILSYEKLASESEEKIELKNREFDELTLDCSRLKKQLKNAEIKTELNEIKQELQEGPNFIESMKNFVTESGVNFPLYDQLKLVNFGQLENKLSDVETKIPLKNNTPVYQKLSNYQKMVLESEEKSALKSEEFKLLSLSHTRLENQLSDVEIQMTLRKSELEESSLNCNRLEKQLLDSQLLYGNLEKDSIEKNSIVSKLSDVNIAMKEQVRNVEEQLNLKTKEFDEVSLNCIRLEEQSLQCNKELSEKRVTLDELSEENITLKQQVKDLEDLGSSSSKISKPAEDEVDNTIIESLSKELSSCKETIAKFNDERQSILEENTNLRKFNESAMLKIECITTTLKERSEDDAVFSLENNISFEVFENEPELNIQLNNLSELNSAIGSIDHNKSGSEECRISALIHSTELIAKTCAQNVLEKDELILNLENKCDALNQHIEDLIADNERLKLESKNDEVVTSTTSDTSDGDVINEIRNILTMVSNNSNAGECCVVESIKSLVDECDDLKSQLKQSQVDGKINLDIKNELSEHGSELVDILKLHDTLTSRRSLLNQILEGISKEKHTYLHNGSEVKTLSLNECSLKRHLAILENELIKLGEYTSPTTVVDWLYRRLGTSTCNTKLVFIDKSALIESVNKIVSDVDAVAEVCERDLSAIRDDTTNPKMITESLLDELRTKNNELDVLKERMTQIELTESSSRLVLNRLKVDNESLIGTNTDLTDKLLALRKVLHEVELSKIARDEEVLELKAKIEALTDKLNDINLKMYTENVKPLIDFDKMLQDNIKLQSELQNVDSEYVSLKSAYGQLLEEHQKLKSITERGDTNELVSDLRNEYEDKLNRMKQKMKQLYQEQISVYIDKQKEELAQSESLCKKYADKIKSYESHVNQLSSELWKVGEKLLMERNEKDWLKKRLKEYGSRQSLLFPSTSDITKNQMTKSSSVLRVFDDSVRDLMEERNRNPPTSKPKKAESGGLHMSDEEVELFDNTYLTDLKNGVCEARIANKTMTVDRNDPNRLSELQWRNSLCLPHLKSSYPLEMNLRKFKENDIKLGSMNLDESNVAEKANRPRKEVGQTSYKRPGPPTPSKKGGRSSLLGNDSREPLKEHNDNVNKKATTPSRIRSLFMGNSSQKQTAKDENPSGTPKGRRLSIFRKPR